MGEAASSDIAPKAAFQSFIDEHLDGVELGEPLWTSKWEIWNRLASGYRRNRIFLVGDSAHVHSPSGGQGMNCCMQDAHNLAWKLSLVLRGKARSAFLDTYQSERKPVAQQVIEGASAIHQIIMGHGVDVENRFELADDPGWLEQAVGRLSGVSYSYRDQIQTPDGLTSLRGPAPGDRAPDVRFGDGRNLYSYLRHPNIVLLSVLQTNSESDIELTKEIFASIENRYGSDIQCKLVTGEDPGLDLEIILDEDGVLASRYQLNESPELFLIRPDAYIGFCCLLAEHQFLMDHLETFLLSQGPAAAGSGHAPPV